MLLAELGLAVDVVGAWVLAVGLFRGPEMVLLYPGGVEIRTPETVAGERSYGAVGGTLLTIGFLGQFLGSVDVGPESDIQMAVIGGALTVVVASGAALLGLEFCRAFFSRRIIRQP